MQSLGDFMIQNLSESSVPNVLVVIDWKEGSVHATQQLRVGVVC